MKVVRTLLVRVFGDDAICSNTGDSHQLRIKHRSLMGKPGFGPYGHLSIPVHQGQYVKGYYLKRIAQAIQLLGEYSKEAEGE